MGAGMNYSKGRAAMQRMSDGKARAFAQNIIIKQGKGRYPKCLKLEPKPYCFCPKPESIPQDHNNVPQECKSCQEYTKSLFWEESTRVERIKRLQSMGIPTRIEG